MRGIVFNINNMERGMILLTLCCQEERMTSDQPVREIFEAYTKTEGGIIHCSHKRSQGSQPSNLT